MNLAFLLLTAVILVAYVLALWHLLRSESSLSLWVLAALTAAALFLRLVEWGSYPGGLNDDEPKVLFGALRALQRGDLFGQGLTGLPQLIPVLFEAQLVALLGAGRWAIRLYSIAGSVLSIPATFAVARSMRMRPISGLAAAAFVVCLPWSLFYGRISQGGELLFNQLLLLAALARLVWRNGTWRDIPIGALGLCLLFYDYFSGRSMLAMPFVAATLARGRQRLWCLAIAAIAVLGFLPQALSGQRYALVGLSLLELHPSYATNPLETFAAKLANSFIALAYPTAANGWMTVNSGAVHPWLILAIAGLGLLTGVRRGLFLAAGFVIGLMPNVLAHGDLGASAHRMHAAYVFIALAAGASLDLIPWRRLRAAAAAAVVLFAAVWSIDLYFSSTFWKTEARWMFANDQTDLVESVPWNEPRVVEADLGYYAAMRSDLTIKHFGAEHLFLPGPALYLFGDRMFPLQRFYESLLTIGGVQTFNRAFAIRANEWDGGWWREHGWSYSVACGTAVRSGKILTLFHLHYTFSDFACRGPAEHLWQAVWRGPATDLRLWFSGNASVQTAPGGSIAAEPGKTSLDFKVEPGATITVRIHGWDRILAALYVVTPQQERLPYWEWVDPGGLPGVSKEPAA